MAWGSSRFADADEVEYSSEKIVNQLGYRISIGEPARPYDDFKPFDPKSELAEGAHEPPQSVYYLLRGTELEKLAPGFSATKIANVLKSQGSLVHDKDRLQKSWNNKELRRRINGNRFYTIDANALFESEA
ncbi:hypothetical protein [Pseudoalteromonas sp. T1lg75]|uniref:hypothetical protein n=1 Tax=Pseudoalteromonas sp. T1lg75 TaxID=2077102 RepID=UPI000CF6BB03|nr:hypothetical protein [Pseudoalteromonas sp. T1lg75]